MLLLITLPFVGALLAVFGLSPHARNAAAVLASCVALASIALIVGPSPEVMVGKVLREEVAWLPSLDVNLVFRMDGLAWIFALLVMGIGALVVLYARYYMSAEDPVPRFFAFLLAFMGAMLGVVLSGNLIQIVVFWELTSIFSFLLIGYWHHNANARTGARMALTVTSLGGFCLLVGMILLGHIAGSYDLDVVLQRGTAIRSDPLYVPTLVLVLAGALSKSAQFPFHFWLPHAMAAPTPVSAYLHSATMVKAGVFLLIRLWPVFAGTDTWSLLVGGAGMTTLLLGAYAAIFQHDLKGLLAYSTISHLGLITLLLGIGSPLAAVAAIFHTLNHATFKASLFMAAGIIDHETGTRDLRRISGLFRFMPITATLAMVAAAAMAGVPLLNGFLSKEMFLAEAFAQRANSRLALGLPILATIASTFSVLYSLRFIHQSFFGPPPTQLPKVPHEPPRWMRFPSELLVLTCLLVGMVPSLTIGPVLAVAVFSVLGPEMPPYDLAIWHGFNPALYMSLAALVGGIVLYVVFRDPINGNPRGAPPVIHRFRSRQWFDTTFAALTWAAQKVERAFATRRLQPQLRILVFTSVLAAVLAASGGRLGFDASAHRLSPVDPAFLLLWVVGCTCAVGAAYQAKFHRMMAMVLLGGAGLVCCLTFIWLSAPDLATTQLLVEIVTTVLLLLGLRWLPKRNETANASGAKLRTRVRRTFDLAVACIAGTGVAILAYAVMTRPRNGSIADFFLERSYADGGGRNVVNVILVDFRAFDTLGEITVLGVVSLTIFALLRRFRPAADTLRPPEQQRRQNAYDAAHRDRTIGTTLHEYLGVLHPILRLLFAVILVLAVHLFLRGHDLPGGGFAAGIAMSLAFIVQYVAFGVRWVEARLRILPVTWIAVGLAIALATGAASWVFGYPFLTATFEYADVPILGRIPLASAVLFDLGVFLLVVGATVLTLIALAHQSIRTPRVTKEPSESFAEADADPAPDPRASSRSSSKSHPGGHV